MKVLAEMLNSVGDLQGEPVHAERSPAFLVDDSNGNQDEHISASALTKKAHSTQSNSSSRQMHRRRLLIKYSVPAIVLVIVSGAILIGIGAYREARFNRQLDAEQNQSLAELKEQAARTNRQLEELVQANGRIFSNLSLSTRLWDDFNKGVCLITGTYVFIDPKSGRPWRLQSKQTGKSGENSAQEEMPGGLTTEGDGEVVQMDYEGTGFHVGAGYILTNRHLVFEPWKNTSWVRIFDDIVKGTPRLTELRAFFPGQKRSYQIQYLLAASQEDLAVCTLNVKEIPREISILPLDQNSASVAVGQPIVMIGYSGGIDRLLAFVSAPQVTKLLERYGDSGLPLLSQLARRDLTKPISSHGHMMDLNANHLIYDSAAGGGGSGSPVFGPSGRVIGIHSGYHQANRITNSAVRIDPAMALLKRAGWRSPELPLANAQ